MSIKKLLEELEDYPISEADGCSCCINPPCNHCIETGNREECIERIKDHVQGDKYLRYMQNVDTGDGISVAAFDNDWEPILSNMVDKGEVEVKEGIVYLVEELYDIIS